MLTRFNNLRYEHFKASLNGLTFEVKLLDDNSSFPFEEKHNNIEEFKVIVTNNSNKRTINFKFYNSQMERNISENIKQNIEQYPKGALKVKEFKSFMNSLMWGGYDKIKSLKELNEARIENLFYSILHSWALDMSTDITSFNDFCDNLGYDNDSRKAEKVFNAIIEQQAKVLSLWLSIEQIKYLNEEVNQETEKFSVDIKQAIQEAKQIKD